MIYRLLAELDYSGDTGIINDYMHRVKVSKRLISLLRAGNAKDYVNLALGIDDFCGNFSAAEHKLGPRILGGRSCATIFDLAKKLSVEKSPAKVRQDIFDANIPFLKVSVGTEMAMLLQPDKHWVANTRSIWSHLFMKHGSLPRANEELRLYRDGSESSEMAYKIWCAVHVEMEQNFICLAKAGMEIAHRKQLESGTVDYLWADAVANALYEKHGT